MLLCDPESEESMGIELNKVELNMKLNAFLNIQYYYENKKKFSAKEQKTMDASKIALKAAEKAMKKDGKITVNK